MKEAFKVSDGDAWYDRNKEHLTTHSDIVLDIMIANEIKPESVLEIGCSNGYRLQSINNNYGSVCWGTDISMDSIRAGRTEAPELILSVSDISMPGEFLKDENNNPRKFDLVIVNFVLHWINRSELMTALANININIKDGGYLILGDFYDYYKQVPYKHREGLYTYKTDYPKILQDTGCYTLIDKAYFDHEEQNLWTEGKMGYNMGKIALLQKRDVYELVNI